MGRQDWFLNWLWSSYLYINAKKKHDYNRFYIFLKNLRIFDPSKFFAITWSLVPSLLVTYLICVVTPITNSNFHTYYSHFKQLPGVVATYKQNKYVLYDKGIIPNSISAYHHPPCKEWGEGGRSIDVSHTSQLKAFIYLSDSSSGFGFRIWISGFSIRPSEPS